MLANDHLAERARCVRLISDAEQRIIALKKLCSEIEQREEQFRKNEAQLDGGGIN